MLLIIGIGVGGWEWVWDLLFTLPTPTPTHQSQDRVNYEYYTIGRLDHFCHTHLKLQSPISISMSCLRISLTRYFSIEIHKCTTRCRTCNYLFTKKSYISSFNIVRNKCQLCLEMIQECVEKLEFINK